MAKGEFNLYTIAKHKGEFDMRYDFSKMDSNSFEEMIRSLNEGIFGIKCEQYGAGPDGQREFVFEGNIKDREGNVFQGRTIGQAKYKYSTTKADDYNWLANEIAGELKRFREKEKEYIPDNYVFYTNIVLTPMKDTGVKDKINAYVKAHNDIIKHFYVRGYDEICAMLDNNRDVATSYAAHILPGDVLMHVLEEWKQNDLEWLKRYLSREFEEEMYTRMEQAGSATEKKISIEKICIDINVLDREQRKTFKFAEHVFALGNAVLGYKKGERDGELERNENYILIGGPGNGKSTICQFIAQVYRENYLRVMDYHDLMLDVFAQEMKESYKYQIEKSRIPFKIALREYAAWVSRNRTENISIIQYMIDRIRVISGDSVSIKTIRRMLNERAWIFFFDGLDEVPESSNRQEVLKQIHIFLSMDLKELSCDCMVVGTTRPQGYNDDFDETRYKHLEVAELSKEDCYRYIQKLFELMEEQTERREGYIRIMREALEDEITCKLMKTPLQITIISILVKSGGKPPHERYSLFQQYYETVIRREKQKEIVATLNDNTAWLEEIHYIIGDKLQCESEKAGNPSAEISREKLETVIRTYVEENQDDFYELGSRTAKKVNEFLMTITERICFLCENREGYYSFSIRSMQEYFAGTYMVKDQGDVEALSNIKRIAYSSYWRNALLFALGYIELQRRSLEPKIGELCEQMNGKDNIIRADYGTNNLCLFGSWLAIDILTEDIFRGKQQDKYIVLAAKVLEMADCDEINNFNNFSLITGAQKDKILHFIKENYFREGKFQEKILKLYLKLNENVKNSLDAEIKCMEEKLSEEQRLMFAIHVLKKGIGTSKELRRIAGCRIEEALEQDKVKFFLPGSVLAELLNTIKTRQNITLRKNLFLQYLFSDSTYIPIEEICHLVGVDMKTVLLCLRPFSAMTYEYCNTIEISEVMNIFIRDEGINEKEIEVLQTQLQELDLIFLANFFDFLLKPTFGKYQELDDQITKEENYLYNKYKFVLKNYIGDMAFATEDEFDEWTLMRKADYEKIIRGDVKELQSRKIGINFGYSLTWCNGILDNLIEETINWGELSALNEEFFDVCMFAVRLQIQCTQQISDICEKTAQHIMDIICEANRRGHYSYPMYAVIGVLLASKYKKELWASVPDLLFVDQCIQQELLCCTEISWNVQCIGEEELQNIIGNIIDKLTLDEKENCYLSIIPLLIHCKIDLRNCISENDIKKLGRIEYATGANILSVKLLQMCMAENADPYKLIEEVLAVNMPHKAIFMELENVLRYCRVENKEKIWVVVYQKLESENFEGCRQIKNRIMNDMMEARCNAVTR